MKKTLYIVAALATVIAISVGAIFLMKLQERDRLERARKAMLLEVVYNHSSDSYERNYDRYEATEVPIPAVEASYDWDYETLEAVAAPAEEWCESEYDDWGYENEDWGYEDEDWDW